MRAAEGGCRSVALAVFSVLPTPGPRLKEQLSGTCISHGRGERRRELTRTCVALKSVCFNMVCFSVFTCGWPKLDTGPGWQWAGEIHTTCREAESSQWQWVGMFNPLTGKEEEMIGLLLALKRLIHTTAPWGRHHDLHFQVRKLRGFQRGEVHKWWSWDWSVGSLPPEPKLFLHPWLCPLPFSP